MSAIVFAAVEGRVTALEAARADVATFFAEWAATWNSDVVPVAAVAQRSDQREPGVEMEIVGQIGGTTEAVAVDGRHAYIGVGPRLVVVDVSDPRSLRVVGWGSILPDVVGDVTVVAGFVYMAAGSAGLRVIDVTVPSNSREVGFVDTPGSAHGVTVAGGHAYVADLDSGLRVIDVTAPARPREVGFVDTPGSAHDVAVVGGYAFVADWDSGLRVIDVTTPASPREVGFVDARGTRIVASGGFVYMAGGSASLRVIDVTIPASPRVVGAIDARGSSSWDVAVVGNSAIVVESGSLRVIDVTEPANLREVSFLDLDDAVGQRIAVVGGHAFVGGFLGGLRVVEVAEVDSPRLVSYLNMPGYTVKVAVAGGYAYAVDLVNGLWAIDVAEPASPRQEGFLDIGHSGDGDVAVAGGHAYVADKWGERLRVIDVKRPEIPREVGALETPGNALGVAVAGEHAFVATEGGLLVIDIAQPESPREVSTIDTPGYATGVAVVGGHAYVADGSGGLRVIDVTAPANPREVGYLDTPGDAVSVAVAGSHAFLANWEGGLRVIDVSTPANPREVGYLDTPGDARSVAVAGSRAFLADGEGGLRVIDVSTPANPREVGFLDTPGWALDVAVAEGLAYVMDGHAGLVIVGVDTLPPPPTPTPLYLPLALHDPSCPPTQIFTDIVLVLDASTSMLERTPSGRTKLDVAVQAARAFVDGGARGSLRLRPGGDQVAIVAFNDQAHVLQDLTPDRARLHAALDRVTTGQFSRIELGILEASLLLLGPGHVAGHTQAMLVLSDGMANPVPSQAAVNASRRSQALNILVYIVGIGPRMDEAVLRDMASRPEYFWPAPNADALVQLYGDLVIELQCPKELYWARRR